MTDVYFQLFNKITYFIYTDYESFHNLACF